MKVIKWWRLPPEGWWKLRWQSPWVATRVSGSTREGRVPVRVRISSSFSTQVTVVSGNGFKTHWILTTFKHNLILLQGEVQTCGDFCALSDCTPGVVLWGKIISCWWWKLNMLNRGNYEGDHNWMFMVSAPEGWWKLRWQSPGVATRVSGSTRVGMIRIRVRTIRREEVITVIVRFIRLRWEGEEDAKEMGARRVRTRVRREKVLLSLLILKNLTFMSHL